MVFKLKKLKFTEARSQVITAYRIDGYIRGIQNGNYTSRFPKSIHSWIALEQAATNVSRYLAQDLLKEIRNKCNQV